jgi:hypothetical protein
MLNIKAIGVCRNVKSTQHLPQHCSEKVQGQTHAKQQTTHITKGIGVGRHRNVCVNRIPMLTQVKG